MNTNSPIFLPVVILVAWTMVMWFWMYLTRLPAMFKMKLRLDSNAPRGEQMNTLPPSVRWKADNYNHLMEQPTIFYAVAIVLAVTPLSVSALLAAIVIGALGIEALLAARGGRRSLLSRIGPLP